MSNFQLKSATEQMSPSTQLVGKLREFINESQLITPALAQNAVSLESLSADKSHELAVAGNNLSAALEAIAVDLGFDNKAKEFQTQSNAAAWAGLLAGNFKAALSKSLEFNQVSTESMAVVPSAAFGLADALDKRSFGLEAYNEQENRNAVVYSIAYNYQSARQDEFGETFFPTLTLTPDQVGFGVTVNLMTVYDGMERKITGSFEDWKKKNIIRAVADPTVMKKEQTKVVPVVRAQTADKFVAAATIPPTALLLEGESINTAPLAFGKKVDLLAVSATDALLAAGVLDQTDSLDPTVNLDAVYVKVGADTLKFNVSNVPYSNFVAATQGNYRLQNLAFTTTSLLLNNTKKNVDGTALADLATVVTNNLIVRLEMQVTGNVNTETGELTVFGNMVKVHSVQNASGDMLDLSASPAADVVTAFAGAQMLGYDILAYRANMNRRQRGQLIDNTRFTQMYHVPLRSPISTQHPVNTDGQTDAADVQALVTATRIRTSNEAVTALLRAKAQMEEYVDSRDEAGEGPAVMGVGRYFVRPTFMKDTVDFDTDIDSIKAHERAEDIQAVLVNKIRDMAYRLYTMSEFKAAADALAGGNSKAPTVIIGCDPIVARYLMVTGDLRTLGGEFDVRIVSTLDNRVRGRVFIAFSMFDEQRNTAPNPLNFGNMVWAPELVLTVNISRNGQTSKETVVQPRYLFCTHCPIMGYLEVENLENALKKVALNFHNV